jgi:glycosyltransferase involved in cell wall biosynthesis
MKRVLVLYREMAGYMLESLRFFAEKWNVEVDVVVYPVNADAPFQFQSKYPIAFFSYSDCSIQQLNQLHTEKKYDLVLCGSWNDKMYLEFIRQHKDLPAVLAFDKQWQGTWKDWLRCAFLRLRVKPLFRAAFVAGMEQRVFAQKMGFNNTDDFEGVYCCSFDAFQKVFEQRMNKPFAKKIWFVGRYAYEKEVDMLFQAFADLHQNELSQWQLHAVGVGPLYDNRLIHPAIVHHGFLQPNELVDRIADGAAFVLPSSYEPWGLVVQEFALAGYPLLLSSHVGARTAFLEHGKNGFLFSSGSKEELKKALLLLAQLPQNRLVEMANESHRLATTINPVLWADTVYHMIGSFSQDSNRMG